MVSITLSLVVLAFSACGRASPVRKTHPTVHLAPDIVRFEGSSANNVESFLNIRFGQDTGGNNRFAPPKPYNYPTGSVVNATQSGAACPQQKVPVEGISVFDNVTHISEDCLTLRVDRPANTCSTAKLPVMVYIYGGGDSIGQIYDSAYDPTTLISGATQKGIPVIYVAMNYRVGVFGFAASPALNDSDSLNAGLLDQRLGLEWVQKHISAFGGDPDNVIIFGESDGATGVGLQITAYGGNMKAPFQRAIMQSDNAAADAGTASNASMKHTAQLIRKLSCTASTSAKELACLRKVPLEKLLSTAVEYEYSLNSYGFDVFIPTAPSTFIPESPSELLRSGRFARNIDMIAGWNENDASLFTPSTLNSTVGVAEFLSASLPNLSKENIQKALSLYPVSSFSDMPTENISAQYFRASQMMRDNQFVCPSIFTVQMNNKYSDLNTSNYLFVLNQTIFAPVYAEEHTSYLGVSHFSDIPYVFNQVNTRYSSIASASGVKLSSEMSGSWASFAVYGDPSRARGTIPDWFDAVSSSNGTERQLSLQVIGGPQPGIVPIGRTRGSYEDLTCRCAFWNSPEVFAQMGV
ncbi:carboxylesterase [Penicillium cinerascens]|uniref:Carboxylesterase n=1 Tax=Penicillium cinerascens TaxID=70096 RepID=A0A9W9TB49_9EURO|nr:carboxylesterase [Penicillium cinerascens]KAJ5216288.1 carboxylesterase [Penicillium cinerascens]